MSTCGQWRRGYSGNQLHIVTDRNNRLKRTRFVVLFGAVSPNRVCQDRNSVRGNHSLYTVWQALPASPPPLLQALIGSVEWGGRGRALLYYLNTANSQSICCFQRFVSFRFVCVAFARFRNAKTCCACSCYYYLSFFAWRQFLCFPVSAVVVVVERKMKAKSRCSFSGANARVRVTICTEHCSLSAHTFCPGQANKIQHQRERGQRVGKRETQTEWVAESMGKVCCTLWRQLALQ